jgi:hypothetical protein
MSVNKSHGINLEDNYELLTVLLGKLVNMTDLSYAHSPVSHWTVNQQDGKNQRRASDSVSLMPNNTRMGTQQPF